LVEAFRDPPSAADKKKLAKILKRPVRDAIADELFTYEGFLRGLGRMNLSTTPPLSLFSDLIKNE
jgi:hypothetical protein